MKLSLPLRLGGFGAPLWRLSRRGARILLVFLPFWGWACGGAKQSVPAQDSFSYLHAQKWLQETLPAVVGVSAVYNYQLTNFHHQYVNGELQPDASSPTGYRLLSPPVGAVAVRELDTQKVIGGGLIIHRDNQKAVILTSAHVFNKPDTLYHYDRLDTNAAPRLMLARSIQKSKSFYVIGQDNQYLTAEILLLEPRFDLALLLVPAATTLGASFPFRLATLSEIAWGDFAYVVGYPREVKQISTGVISRVQFAGSFILDTVARFGFSGGPVFVVRPEKGLELVGLIRGVPASKLRYVAPAKEIPAGQLLNDQDLREMSSQEIDMIDYGTTYAVSIDYIKKFLQEARDELRQKGITLENKYLE